MIANLAYIFRVAPGWLLLYGAAALGLTCSICLLFNYGAHRMDRYDRNRQA